jgi:hypothetical protein
MMMIDELCKFISKNGTQVWTLVSVVLGGMVTYISTSKTEERKYKRQLQREKMEQILIPYCNCIETTIGAVKNSYVSALNSQNTDIQSWFDVLKEPLMFLNTHKGVYLSTSTRNLLKNYESQLEKFELLLEEECNSCLIKYKFFIAKILSKFPNIKSSIDISFSMKKNTKIVLKLALIKKAKISLINQFRSICFVHNDDPDNYDSTNINISEEYRLKWDAINNHCMDYNDITNSEEELACLLLDFIEENVLNEPEALSQIIEETCSADLLRIIADNLEEMHKKLLKEIYKITK